MKLLITDPNFSIILPGCNAACDFCFAEKYKSCDKRVYLENLNNTLKNLPPEFFQISITGGEPTIHPWFKEVLYMVSQHKRFTKVVLTSNGTNLLYHIKNISGVVNHINLSIHHYDDVWNQEIFKGSYNLRTEDHKEIVDAFGAEGIDVSISCVIDDNTKKHFVDKFIEMSKYLGARSVRFRKINGDNVPVKVESEYSKYKVAWTGSCPVCVTRKRIISGMDVYWKTSVIEPDSVTNGEIFELIYHPNGIVYSDWKGQHPVVGAEKKKVSFFDTPMRKVPTYKMKYGGNRPRSAGDILEAYVSGIDHEPFPETKIKMDKSVPVGMYYSGRFKTPPATSCGSGGCGSHKTPRPVYGCGGGSGGGCGR
jgi:organic radical activating enzyme